MATGSRLVDKEPLTINLKSGAPLGCSQVPWAIVGLGEFKQESLDGIGAGGEGEGQ
jgi:hypothetical protein